MKITTIFGTKVSVISCTCVSACMKAITRPTISASARIGPEAMSTTQNAPDIMS